jgi:hypothetical protein
MRDARLWGYLSMRWWRSVYLSLFILTATPAGAAEPIRLHPSNPHYFEFRGKPTVLITSAEHYGVVLNLDFDYKRYLRTLAADRLNLTRTFAGSYREGPESFGISGNTLAPAHDRFIAPWPRTDVRGAVDGLGKFDLERWNDAYFSRLKDFLREAGARGIVVELTLFCPFYRDEMWNLSPLNARNNVNGIGDYKRQEVYNLKDPAMQRVQDALVEKIVAELREFDNVMFEICNEPYAYEMVTADWQRHIADVIAGAEADLPPRQRHLITQNVANGSRKVPEPNARVSVFNFHYSRPPESVALNRELERPIGCNETGFDGQSDAAYRVQGWEFIFAGGALYNNLDYSFAAGREDGTYVYPAGQPGGGSTALRRQLRVLRDFMDSIDYLAMHPSRDLVRSGVPEGSSAWMLGAPGKAYALYLHHGAPRKGQKPQYVVDATRRTAELGLDLAAGNYKAEWIDTKTGKVAKQERFSHQGGTRTLVSPAYGQDIALRVLAR